MFQLGKLVLLCGLLIGATEALLGDFSSTLSKTVDTLKPVIEGDNSLNSVLGGDNNLLPGDIQKITDKLQEVQLSEPFQQVKSQLLDATNLVKNPLSLFTANGLQLKITDIVTLGVKPELSVNGKDLQLRVPVGAKVSVTLPLLRQVIDLSATMDLVGGLKIEKDPQTQQLKITIGKCSSDLDSLSISLLNRKFGLLNSLLDVTSNVLRTGVSFLLQHHLCPLLQTLVNTLNVSLGSDILSALPADLPVAL